MRIAMLSMISFVLFLGACASVHTSTADALMPLQTHSSFDPLFYVGSDDHYHYFDRLNLKYWQKYRVPRSELSMSSEFPLESDSSMVMTPGALELAKTSHVPPNKSLERTRDE